MSDAIMLLAFGGPESMAEVRPFLTQVSQGAKIPLARLATVAKHYEHFDGYSPLNKQNRDLAKALNQALALRGHNIQVLVGNRHGSNRFREVLEDLSSSGAHDILAVATTPFTCYSACRQYRENLAEASAGLNMKIAKVPNYFDMPGLVEAQARLLAGSLVGWDPTLIFTTHSIPTAGSEEYLAQHSKLCQLVSHRAGELLGTEAPTWRLVFQSRSGNPHTPWLEPDICDVVDELADGGVRDVLIDPIGFLSDHMEVLWDLDTEASAKAKGYGMNFRRVPTVGTHPVFVGGLADLIVQYLEASELVKVEEPDPAEIACYRPALNS
uniref:ferrochelatase n=1 Tax=Vaginimicrobium propionicum TaxID=1871034 RepID=UPI000970CE79|nr:ferrochelatase [Vaginimicrobium propionicum]